MWGFRALFSSKGGFPGGSAIKNLPVVQETRVPPLGQEDALEKEMATHSSTLAWRIPWTEEPGGLQSMGSQRVRHDCPTNTLTLLKSKGRHVTQCLLKEGTDKAESLVLKQELKAAIIAPVSSICIFREYVKYGHFRASQVALVVKSMPARAGDMRHRFDPWVQKMLRRREWQPIPVFLPGESHGQRSLAGYGP